MIKTLYFYLNVTKFKCIFVTFLINFLICKEFIITYHIFIIKSLTNHEHYNFMSGKINNKGAYLKFL